ncbi:MAG: hypothetical protein ACI9OJ_004203 [Myxococcota bacterium]|jgi:hypothetical protein
MEIDPRRASFFFELGRYQESLKAAVSRSQPQRPELAALGKIAVRRRRPITC